MSSPKKEKHPRQYRKEYGIALGAGLGITFGPVLGTLIDRPDLGISLGLVFGALIGTIFGKNIAQLFGYDTEEKPKKNESE